MKTAATKRCAVYCRQSVTRVDGPEFTSCDAQREACQSYVQVHRHEGWTLIPERFDDGGFSGKDTDRPAFQRLLAAVDGGLVDVIVVYKVDRLSRSLLDFARIMDRFDRAGVAFVSVTQNFSTADATGRMILGMLINFAEFERSLASERTRDKIAASRRHGKWTGGPVPLGYDVEDGRLVTSDTEAFVVLELFAFYLQHRSALIVARELNARKRRTKLVQTKAGEMRGARPWTKDAVLRVLRNPVYAGYTRCGDELYDGEHDAIIDAETWIAAGALLASRGGPLKSHGRNPDYFLRGLLFCACCGGAYTTASTRRGRREYRYYRCVRRDKKGADACEARPLPADAIEGFVLERIRGFASDSDLIADVERRLKARVATTRAELEVERARLPQHIARLSAEGRSLVGTMAEMRGGARRLVDARVQELGADLGRSETRLAEVERDLAALRDAELDAEWVAAALRDFETLWEVMTPQNRARLVGALVRRVDVDEPAGEVSIRLADIGVAVEDTGEPDQTETGEGR